MEQFKLFILTIVLCLAASPVYAVKVFLLEGGQAPDNYASRAVIPKEDYLTIEVKSMQLNKTTVGFKKYYASTQGTFKFQTIGQGELVKFESVTKPSKLIELDGKHQDRIAHFNQNLLGPVPYAGGPLHIAIGLLSVKSVDLSEPYLKLLGSIGESGGVSFLNKAMPFVPLIKEGVNVLAGTSGNSILQAAYDSKWDIVKTGYYVMVRDEEKKEGESDTEVSNLEYFYTASKKRFDYKSLKIIRDTNIPGDLVLADLNNTKIEGISYVIVFVNASNTREDYGLIPEISKAYNETFNLLFSGDVKAAEESLLILNTKVRQSWDLQLAHKIKLIAELKIDFDKAKKELLENKQPSPLTRNIRELNSYSIFNNH